MDLGLDGLSIQAIATRLGVSPATLYSHVGGRREISTLVDAALRERLRRFDPDAGDWRSWLRGFAHLVRDELGPSATALLTDPPTTRSPRPAGNLAAGEEGLKLLLAQGLTPQEAGQVLWLVFRVALTAAPGPRRSLDRYVADTAEAVEPGAAPATRAVQHALTTGGAGDTLDLDLDLVLDGIARRIADRSNR